MAQEDTNSTKRKAAAALEGQFDDSDEDVSRTEEAPEVKERVEAPKQEKKTESEAADEKSSERPVKKAKADKKEEEVSASVSAKDAIQNALARVSKPALSDYEKCSIFPQKLMQLLKNDEAPDAIWWLEDGESFAIEQENFTKVMNKVSRTSKKKVKLDSILRNLYRWGFKKLKDRDMPANVLAYSHPKFKRDACVELQTFSKKSNEASTSASSGAPSFAAPPPTALARALSARAQAGYGENWNEEGAADKSTMAAPANPYGLLAQQNAMMGGAGGGDQRMMFMLQQQQQQRQLFLQQELMFHEQQQRQALLFEAAAAEQAYAAQRYAGAGGYPGFPHYPSPF